jgi:hypothetical protein
VTPSSPPESTRGIAQLIASKWWPLLLRALLLIALGLYALAQAG